MRVMVLERNETALSDSEEKIRSVVTPYGAEVRGFCSPADALRYAEGNRVDTAYFEMDMPAMHGMVFASKLRKLNPNMNLVFLSDTRDYVQEFFKIFASGYLVRPFSKEDVLKDFVHHRGALGNWIREQTPGWNSL